MLVKMKIPQIKYHAKGRTAQLGFIEIDGECVHELHDLDAFYQVFGYSAEVSKAGILPDEFIWDKYIKDNSRYTHCLQIHLIDYLKSHSEAFRKKYGVHADVWITYHAKSTAVKNDLCAACRMLPACSENFLP